MIGTSVEWYPSNGTGYMVEHVVTIEGTTVEIPDLKGKKLLAILRNNECLTDFSGFPNFGLDPVTGIINGFPVSIGEKLIITFTKP